MVYKGCITFPIQNRPLLVEPHHENIYLRVLHIPETLHINFFLFPSATEITPLPLSKIIACFPNQPLQYPENGFFAGLSFSYIVVTSL